MRVCHRTKAYRDILSHKEVHVKDEDQFIPDPIYIEVLKRTVISCTDAVFVVPGDQAIYLAKRSILPMRGVWCFGGRVFFNDETLEDSISRCVLKETGLKIDSERFHFLRVNYYSWQIVAQGNFPGKNLGITFVCSVSQEEIEEMRKGLSEKEYDKKFGIQRFDRERLIREDVHEAMIDLFNQIFLS